MADIIAKSITVFNSAYDGIRREITFSDPVEIRGSEANDKTTPYKFDFGTFATQVPFDEIINYHSVIVTIEEIDE